MKILDIALKDLLRSIRSLFFLGMALAAPMVIVGLIYLAFGGLSSGRTDLPQLQVGVVNLDVPPAGLPALGQAVLDQLSDSSVSAWLKASIYADEAAARRAVDQQHIGLAVILPPDFSQAAITGQGRATITLVQDPTLSITPAVVKNMIGSLLDGVNGARLALQVAGKRGAALDASATQKLVGEYQAWFTNFQRTLYHSPEAAMAVQAPSSAQAAQNGIGKLIGMVMAGMMVFFCFTTGANAMQTILREDEEGTLPRLFTTPTGRTTILAGKFLAVFLVVALQSLALMGLSALAFGFSWGNPLTCALIVAGQVATSTGLGALLISLIKTTRQAGAVVGGVLTALGMLGGLFTVAVQMPGGFEIVNHLTPQGWVLAGWKAAAAGAGPAEVLSIFAILLVMGAGMFLVGARIFARRYA